MRNLWIQAEHPFATWVANLDVARSVAQSLLEFAVAVIHAGAKQHVFDVVWAPLIDYQRGRGRGLVQRLEDLYRERRTVDMFGFTDAAMAAGAPGSSTCEATLAWYDANDRLVEGTCSDLGALLKSLEPVAGSIPNGCAERYPPVRVTGHRLEYDDASFSQTRQLPPGRGRRRRPRSKPTNHARRRPLEVRFEIHSDIWLPWVFGSAHPQADHRRMFDNRELATIHTPRLNAFLQTVAAETRSRGGRWYIDPFETGRNAITWLDENGIDLDAPPPAETFPPSALDVEWY